MDKSNNQSTFIEKIELELLSTLVNYAVPFIDKKIKTQKERNQKTGKLENLINSNPKIDFKDLHELEALIQKNLNDNVKSNKNFEIRENNVFYSLNLRRQKSNDEQTDNYSISIKYEENQTDEKLSIKVKKEEKEIYSAEIINKKNAKDKVAPYSIKISYEGNYAEERLFIIYKQQLKNYMQKHIESKEDMTNRVPLKWLNIMPETMMGGVLGFTYLGENFMARRADLTGKTARMVDIHESIHTPDEYETRCITQWIMSKERSKYIKKY